jgi:hypothetical protein
MASGHVNRALTGRTHGCSDHCCTREESSCQPGAVHTWPNSAVTGIHPGRQLLVDEPSSTSMEHHGRI